MIERTGVVVLCGAVVGLWLGCGEQSTVEAAPSLMARREAVATAPPLDPAAAAVSWRYIGIKQLRNAACPVPAKGPWVVRHLFGSGPTPAGVVPGLRAFCLYSTSVPPSAPPPELLALVTDNGLVDLDADLAAVAPAGDAADATADLLAARTHEQAGRVQRWPTPESAVPARIAVLDTQPTGVGSPTSPGTSTHGYDILGLAHDLVCDDVNDCAATLTSRLALALRYDSQGALIEDTVNGGELGTTAWLAEAVQRETDDWVAGSGATKGLVLNLSLGWLGLYGGTTPLVEDWPTSVQAVYRALEYASCRKAVVVAAAGNRTGGQTDRAGPMLPAAWEQRRAPSAAECAAFLGKPAGPPHPDRPLVYAAAGVDFKGDDLANARPSGRSRMVAYSDHALPEAAAGGPLAGSSVAAAVVSASVAAVIHFDDTRTPHQAMDGVYSSGQSVGRPADFCLVPPCGPARRITVCESLSSSCTARPCGSLAFDACPAWDPSPIAADAIDTTVFDQNATAYEAVAFAGPESHPVCGPQALYTASTIEATDPCPHRQYYSLAASPFVGPMPQSDPCPSCAVSLQSAMARLENDEGFDRYGDVVLTLISSSGSADDYNLGPLGSDTQVLVELDDAGVLGGVWSVYFNTSADGVSYSTPLVLTD